MADEPTRTRDQDARNSAGGRTDQPDTTPDQERGERLDTGKTIARGGKEHGSVPGAEEQR